MRFKLAIAAVIVEAIMLSLLLLNTSRLLSHSLNEHTESITKEMSPLLGAALSARLFERDHASIVEILSELITDEDKGINYVIIYDNLNEIYAFGGDIDPKQPPGIDKDIESALGDQRYDISETLTLAGQPVGRMQYGFSLAPYLSAKDQLLSQGVAIAFFEVFFSAILLTFLGFLLTRHIKTLVTATDYISKGDYGYAVDIRGNDEISELARNFNTMRRAIRHRIAQLNESERKLFAEKERALVTLHSIGDAVITTDVHGNIEYMNPIAESLTAWPLEQAAGQPLQKVFYIVNELNMKPLTDPVKRCINENRVIGMNNHTVLINRRKERFSIQDTAAPIRDSSGAILGAVLVFHDVSLARQMARQMDYQAKHDSLTGLLNRKQFEVELVKAFDNACDEHRRHAFCYIDVDQFKVINDTCGHLAGDELLKNIAQKIRETIRDSDLVGRLGGDEFGIIVRNCPLERVVEICENITSHLEAEQFCWQDKCFTIGASIGVAPINSDSHDICSILSAADVACYVAKEKGRGQIHVFEEKDETHKQRLTEMELTSEITEAINQDRLEIHCQKIVDLNDDTSRMHYEALVRMRGKNGELLLPMQFIPAAERYHLISKIDCWMVEKIVEVLENCTCNQDIAVAINLSGQSLADKNFLSRIDACLKQTNLDTSRIYFEITETAAIENLEQAYAFIRHFRKFGIRFLLDDFGSGLSSFGYLKNLEVDFIKIDGSFIRDMHNSPTDIAIVETIHQIGHIMGKKTIAEYIETDDLLSLVSEIGIDYAQGYAIHEPQPIEAIIEELRDRAWHRQASIR